MRLHGECSTTTRQHTAIRKNLQSLIKPTISVSLLGGIDGLINLLIPLLQITFWLTLGDDSIARILCNRISYIPSPVDSIAVLPTGVWTVHEQDTQENI